MVAARQKYGQANKTPAPASGKVVPAPPVPPDKTKDAPKSSFKEQYAKMPPGQARENFVFQHAIQQGKPNLVPITVPGPNNTKITYRVMPDFFMIDGIRVSLSPYNAQRIADHFGMRIPTTKMADQIYRNSNAVAARPFSGTGATIDGRRYTPEAFTASMLGDSRANIAYSEMVDRQIAAGTIDPNKPIDGFAKYITQPDVPGRASLYGLWTDPNKQQTGKAIQGGTGLTPHGTDQVEYCTYGRFADPNVTITRADGTVIPTTLDHVLDTPKLSSSLTHAPGKGTQRYSQKKAGPPPGYRSAQLDPEIVGEAQAKAKTILNRPMWTELQFTTSNGKTYIAKIEPHSNAPKGVSLYEPINQNNSKPTTTQDPKPESMPVASKTTPEQSAQKANIMDKIRNFLDTLSV